MPRETHGMYGTAEYWAWKGMIGRCYNPNSKRWRLYGGRGISVCDAWRRSFAEFYNAIGPRPGPDYVLDRIDNDGNYRPGNVRWATKRESTNNRRVTLMVAFEDRTKPLTEWVEELGLDYELARERLVDLKWTPARAFCPFKQRKNRTYLFHGRSLTLSQWAAETDLTVATLRKRLKLGWPIEKVLTVPNRLRRQKN